MIRILITGKNSYIGTSFEKWMRQYDVNNFEKSYAIDTVDMIDGSWREKDFSEYDVVFHVAGIAHVDSKKGNKELYYRVNRDLTIETAKKAKKDGVKQFIFMSSIIVYGEHYTITKPQCITKDTKPKPTNYYGMSKLLAEKGIMSLQSEDFNVVVLRPPMIYGKGCKGNYPKLAKFARITPVFPNINNKRSMLYIDNMCEFIKLMVVNNEKGIYCPQNKEYVQIKELIHYISLLHQKKLKYVKNINSITIALSNRICIINKIFGSLYYENLINIYEKQYQVIDFKTSIHLTENFNKE